jgi:hypothetical protein
MSTLASFVVRIVTADDSVRETEFDNGRITARRTQRSRSLHPTLEIYVPRLSPDDDTTALVDNPYPPDRVFVVSEQDGRSELHRLFPLCLAGASLPALLPELSLLWILRNGPFGTFAWRNVFVDGRCKVNDAVAVGDTEGMPWDVIIDIHFTDCISYFLGELEIRDLIAQGSVRGTIGALSALCWFVERVEMTERAAQHREQAELLRAWAHAVNGVDAVLAVTCDR